MSNATESERRRLLFVPCRTCGARVGEECDVDSVVPTAMHPPRFQDLLDSNTLRSEVSEEMGGNYDYEGVRDWATMDLVRMLRYLGDDSNRHDVPYILHEAADRMERYWKGQEDCTCESSVNFNDSEAVHYVPVHEPDCPLYTAGETETGEERAWGKGLDPDAIESARMIVKRQYRKIRGFWHADVKGENKDYYENIIENLERLETLLRDE